MWSGKKKCSLKKLTTEFGADIAESNNIGKIIQKKLIEITDYDEPLALAQLKSINTRLCDAGSLSVLETLLSPRGKPASDVKSSNPLTK